MVIVSILVTRAEGVIINPTIFNPRTPCIVLFIHCIKTVILHTIGVIIGFMDTHYTVREDSGQVNVCIVIVNEARVDFDFTVEFSTVDGTAGIIKYFF